MLGDPLAAQPPPAQSFGTPGLPLRPETVANGPPPLTASPRAPCRETRRCCGQAPAPRIRPGTRGEGSRGCAWPWQGLSHMPGVRRCWWHVAHSLGARPPEPVYQAWDHAEESAKADRAGACAPRSSQTPHLPLPLERVAAGTRRLLGTRSESPCRGSPPRLTG
ncbi:unnamed protein product [Coccothraustes coccothraustes]